MGIKRALRVFLTASTLLAVAQFGLPTGAAQAGETSAVELAVRGDYSGAAQQAASSQSAAAIHLVEFLYLKDHWKDAGYARIARFLQDAPQWPLSETLRKRAEHQLYADSHSANEIRTYFAHAAPLTAEGHLALARAGREAGDAAAVKAHLRAAWTSADLDDGFERQALKEFGSDLSEQDQRLRVWALILAQESNAALRNARRLGGDIQAAAETAQLLLRFVSGADRKYQGLPAAMRERTAMKYALARYYRKNEKFQKARAVLETITENPAEAIDPQAVWTERRIIARRLLGPSQHEYYRSAYGIASNSGLTKGDEAVEAQFLSGWIALRFLKEPATALGHFKALADLAPTRTEKARAQYWIGRALEAQGNKSEAASAFEKAAQHASVYYGQLAREEVGLGRTPQRISDGTASGTAVSHVERDELIHAFMLYRRAGAKPQLNMFLSALASRFDSADELNAVANIVHDAGGTAMAVRFAKAAGKRGFDIDAWGYPVRGLPDWKQAGKPIEKALVFALSRQESEFDAQAGSQAGAQGLMQLMPGTARLVARQYGLSFAAGRLKSDPAYNVRLGAAHLADLVADYNGSYVLTLVAYNAGPRRVGEWIAAYGDPRSAQIDPIDWVESIPFQETRQYVQKVMQNVHIYRSRLAPKTVGPMTADLRRGGAKKVSELVTGSVTQAECRAASISDLIKSCD
ncbi:MAG: hypothetical protein RIS52_1911 [Pseudomonadota bacterium]